MVRQLETHGRRIIIIIIIIIISVNLYGAHYYKDMSA